MSEDEFLRNQREMFFDKKFMAKLEAANAGGEAGEKPGGGGGLAGGLGDLGGGLGGDKKDDKPGDALGDLGGDKPPGGGGAGETPTGGEPGGDEGGDNVLLATPPAKRDDDSVPSYTRGSYNMKKGAGSPARKKRHSQFHKKVGDYGQNSRSVNPAMSLAGTYSHKIDPLSYGKLEEQKSFEDLEEQKLFTANAEINTLINSLFKKEDKHET